MTAAHPASKNSVLLMKPLSMTSSTSQRLVIKSTDCYCLLSSQYRKKATLSPKRERPWIMLSTEKSFCVKIASKTFLECSRPCVTLTLTLHDLKKSIESLGCCFFSSEAALVKVRWPLSSSNFRPQTAFRRKKNSLPELSMLVVNSWKPCSALNGFFRIEVFITKETSSNFQVRWVTSRLKSTCSKSKEPYLSKSWRLLQHFQL